MTFITAYGRYRYLRLPFGVKSAPEVMHKAISQMHDSIGGVECYIVDILVWGRDQAEHDGRLRKVLQKCRRKKLALNKDTCKIPQPTVKFIGHEMSTGLAPSRDQI